MPIDYLIGTLIIVSTVVNALALGAFWITPGLRTTANRFVINLLIVNLVGCVALTPSLFGGWTITSHSETERFTQSMDASTLDAIINGTVRELIDLDSNIERAVELVSESAIMQAVAVLVEGSTNADTTNSDSLKSTQIDPETKEAVQIDPIQLDQARSIVFWGNTRYWGFDLTAALGRSRIKYIIGCVKIYVFVCAMKMTIKPVTIITHNYFRYLGKTCVYKTHLI